MTNTITAGRPACLSVRIPDALACLSPRARRAGGHFHIHPFFSLVTSQPEQSVTRSGWLFTGVHSIEHRSLVTFHKTQVTFQFLSRKTGTLQSGESPWELADAKEKEVDPTMVDYQLHGLQLTYVEPQGDRSYRPDCVHLDADGVITATEVKASPSYFVEPKYASLMRLVERDLPTVGIRFAKRTGDEVMAPRNRRRRYNVNRAFDDRFTRFDERQLDAVANRFAAEGPEVPLGRIGEAMGVHPSAAIQVVNALMCTRHLAYDLDVMVSADTPLRQVPKARRGLADIRAIAR